MDTRRTGDGQLPGPREWHAHALIGVLVLLFFRDILLRTSFFWEDFLYQYYAFRTFAATSLVAGQLPLWNPYTFNGMPFQADIQSAIFYLPNLLLTPFAAGGHLDYWLVELSIILHFALAGSGMYLLARHFGLERVHALFSAIAYAFSGFLVGHLIHLGFIYQAAWFPLIFLTFRKALLGRSYLQAIISGLLLGHAILAGAPQITLFIVFFLFLYFLFELGTALLSGGWKPAAGIVPIAAVPIVLAVLVTAVQLLPTAELAPLSARAEMTYEQASAGSLDPSQLIMLAVPKYFGSTGARATNYAGLGEYWQYWEAQGYIGVSALAFAIVALVALRKIPVVWFLAGTILFGFLYGLGSNFFLHRFFHEHVPGFESFRVPARMVLFYCFAGSLLAGFGLKEIASAASGDRAAFTRNVAIWIAGGAVALFIAGQTGVFVPALPGQPEATAIEAGQVAAAESLKAAIFLMIAAAGVFAAGRKLISPAVFAVLIVVLQIADGHIFGFDQNNGTVNPDEYFAKTSNVAEFFREKGEGEYFRVNSREGPAMLLDRNQGMIDRIFLMEGYTPLVLTRFIPPMSTWARTCDLMNAKYRILFNQGNGEISIAEASGYAPRAFVVHHGTLAASAEAAKAKISDPAFDPMREVVFESAPPSLYEAGDGDAPGELRSSGSSGSPGSSAAIESYKLNEIRLRAEAGTDGYLVLSEVWYPGWKATVDGADAPVLRADWCLRAVPITAGKHEVVLEYSPSSFRTGAWISSLTVALAIAGIAYTRKKENG